MIYLFLSVACSTLIALLLKSSEGSGRNRLTVTTINYVVAASVSLILFLGESGPSPSVSDLAIPLQLRLWEPGFPPSALHSMVWAVAVGLFGGLAYFAGFMTIQRSIRNNGVAITGAVSKLAILIPMVLSMLFWHNLPGWLQSLGIVLALGAILMAHLSGGEWRQLRGMDPVLLWMFLSVGMGEFANKLFQEYGMDTHKGLFLLTVFLTALVISMAALIRSRQQLRRGDVVMGVLVGIPNMLTSLFLIKSFATVPAVIAFPVYGAGTITLVALGGRLIFGESLRKREWAAIGTAVLAVILMQMG